MRHPLSDQPSDKPRLARSGFTAVQSYGFIRSLKANGLAQRRLRRSENTRTDFSALGSGPTFRQSAGSIWDMDTAASANRVRRL